MKKIITVLSLLALFLVFPVNTLAQDSEEIICPQPYGGGVVCGVHTHVPVNTGLGDNLPLIGLGFIGASATLFYLSKKFSSLKFQG